MSYDALVYGPLFCDLIFTGLDEMPKLGTEIFASNFKFTVGGSAIIAAGLHHLGANVGLIADLGNDPLSRLAASTMDEIGLDRTLVREHGYDLPQLTVALSFPQDRAFVTRFEKPKFSADLATILREHPAKHVHMSSFLAVFDVPDACKIAHDAGATISMDPGWDEEALRDPRVHAMLPELDYFLPSRSELCFMMEEDEVEVALQKALSRMPNGKIIMKDGANGALARGDGLDVTVPALPVTPIDTTGAGDAFDAGFIYALTQNYTIEECMRYGAVCGALTTTAVGGATGTPSLEDVHKWLPKLQS